MGGFISDRSENLISRGISLDDHCFNLHLKVCERLQMVAQPKEIKCETLSRRNFKIRGPPKKNRIFFFTSWLAKGVGPLISRVGQILGSRPLKFRRVLCPFRDLFRADPGPTRGQTRRQNLRNRTRGWNREFPKNEGTYVNCFP